MAKEAPKATKPKHSDWPRLHPPTKRLRGGALGNQPPKRLTLGLNGHQGVSGPWTKSMGPGTWQGSNLAPELHLQPRLETKVLGQGGYQKQP